jgi:zinc transport system substrate-binding protein
LDFSRLIKVSIPNLQIQRGSHGTYPNKCYNSSPMKKSFKKYIKYFLIVSLSMYNLSFSVIPDKLLHITTTFYPMYIFTWNITHDIPGITLNNLTSPQTGCLHDYQLTPENLKILEKTDILVINGFGMEAFMEKVLKQFPTIEIINASKGIKPILDEHGKPNPHFWVSISLAIQQIKNITTQLSALDKSRAKAYQINSSTYLTKLYSLQIKMHQVLSKYQGNEIVTFHEAFTYFAQEFKLRSKLMLEKEPGTTPSPKEISKLIALIKQQKIKNIYIEPQYSPKTAQTIARETGSKIFVLDPMVTGYYSLSAYENIMGNNLKILEESLCR